MRVIVVVGEALVDLVVDAKGAVTAALGGAPVNTSRACGRLGAEVSFGGAISVDRFGSMLAAQLAADNVALDLVERCDEPTTLAVAELDERGTASYRFYVEGTSAPSYTTKLEDRRPDWLFTGGLGLVFEPMADTVEVMLDDRPAGCAVMVDFNCRPRVVRDRERYLSRLDRVARACRRREGQRRGRRLPDTGRRAARRRPRGAGARAARGAADGGRARGSRPDRRRRDGGAGTACRRRRHDRRR